MPRLKLLMPRAGGSPLPAWPRLRGGRAVDRERIVVREGGLERAHGDAAVQIDAELLDGVPLDLGDGHLEIDLILALRS